MNILTHALSVWAQHREFRAVFAKLTRYTDRELCNMGIEQATSPPDRLPRGGAARGDARRESGAPAIAAYNQYLLAAG